MITFITGKPGGGKGLISIQQHVDELKNGKRPIITSLPVRVNPWVNGSWKPMIGLRNYLQREFKTDFDVDKRVFLLDDAQAAEFFLYRVIDGKLVKAEAEYKESQHGERRLMAYDTKVSAESGPVLYCVDEAWKFWGSRNWQRTGEGMLFYGAQHRHFGDDVLIVTQHTKQIDPAIQRVAQDFWVVRNHGKMTFGMFRQPAVFSVCIYDQAPTGASIEPMSRKVFTLDRAGLAQCYDTSAGVGLSGRLMADVGAKGKGLPWWMMIVAVFAILIGLWFAIRYGAHMITHGMMKGSKAVVAKVVPVTEKVVVRSPTAVAGVADNSRVLVPDAYGAETNEVFCSGYFMMPGSRVVAFLTDGRIADSKDGEVQRIYKRKVEVFGQSFPIHRREPDYQIQSQVPGFSAPVAMPVGMAGIEEVRSPVVAVIPSRGQRPGGTGVQPNIQDRMRAGTVK
jgi:hypothetical protein